MCPTRPGPTRTPPTRHRVVALATTGLATAVILTVSPTAATAATSTTATTADTCVRASTADWSKAVTRARAALAASVADIGHHRYAKAVTHLRTLKIQVRKAHTGATALIGKPPTDPESDDPPGVNAVLKVSGLEHKITMQLVPLFNHLSRSSVVAPLGYTLNVTDACRDVMLGKVISLKAGARDDYTDGLSDTLPGYKAELNAFSTALSTYTLTTRGRHALTRAKGVVTGTNNAMQQVFGGGERSPA